MNTTEVTKPAPETFYTETEINDLKAFAADYLQKWKDLNTGTEFEDVFVQFNDEIEIEFFVSGCSHIEGEVSAWANRKPDAGFLTGLKLA